MTTAIAPSPRRTDTDAQVADVFVIFGITGDLAKVMTFNSLYRLEQRGLLTCPIVGVAVSDWSADDLRDHAREAIVNCGTDIDEAVFDRLAARMSYVSGDFDDGRYVRAGRARARGCAMPGVLPGNPTVPVRSGDQRVDRRRVNQDRTGGGREAVRARPRVGTRAGGGDPPVHPRGPALPDRSLPGEDGDRGDHLPAVRERDVRADLEPQLRLERADHDGRELRRRGSRPLLRPGRGAARRRRQPHDAGGGGFGDGGTVLGGGRRPERCTGLDLPRDAGRRSGALRARAVRGLPRDRRGSARFDHGDVRRASAGDRQLAVVGGALLPPDGEVPAGHADRASGRVPPSPAPWFHGLGARARAQPTRRQDGPDDRDPAPGRRPAPRGGRAGANQPRHGVRPGGRRGPDPVRGAPARRADRRQQTLHPSGRRRGVLAGDGAVARASPAGAPVRQGIVGSPRGGAGGRGLRALAQPWVAS